MQVLASDIEAKLPPGLSLAGAEVTPPRVPQFTWSVSRASNIVRIDGFVPSDAAKKAIYADVRNRFEQATVKDNSVVAAGGPDDFIPAAKIALNQVEIARWASASLSGSNYSIVADLKPSADSDRSKVEQAFKTTADTALPSSFDLRQVKIVRPAATKDDRSVDLLFVTDRVR